MGILDGVTHFISDIADKVEKGAEAVERVAKAVGLDKVAKFAGSVNKYAKALKIAPGPILSGGQKIIDKMRDATGKGDPERAAAYGDAGRAFHAARDTLAKAHPTSQWEGTGAKMYSERNSEQENVTATIGDTDMQVATIISSEADQLVRLRRILDYNHDLLADVGEWTQWLGTLGPEGKAAQALVEGFYVAMALEQCTPEMWQMHNDANANAAAIRGLRDVYQQARSKVTISDSTGDFDPRNTGPTPPGPPTPGAPPPASTPPAGQSPAPGGPASALPPPAAPAPAAPAPVPAAPAPAAPAYAAPVAAPAARTSPAPPAAASSGSAAPGGPRYQLPAQSLSTRSASNPGTGAASGSSGGRAPVELPATEAETANSTQTQTSRDASSTAGDGR